MRNSLPNFDSNQDRGRLAATFTTTSNHPGRLQSHRNGVLLGAFIAITFTGVLYVGEPNDPKSNALMFLFGSTGVSLLLSCLLMPRRWIAAIVDFFFSQHSLEEVLRLESKTAGGAIDFAKEMVVYFAILTLFYIAWALFQTGNVFASLALGTVLCIWVATLVNRQKFRGPGKLKASLSPELQSIGYTKLAPAQVKLLSRHYAETFLAQDMVFQLTELWLRQSGKTIHWGYYSCGGETLSSGVFGSATFDHSYSPLRVGSFLSDVSSVYYDEASSSIYGTFKGGENLRVDYLAGVPWQYVPSRRLIVRFDSWLLDHIENNSELSEISMPVLIDAFTLLIDEIEADGG